MDLSGRPAVAKFVVQLVVLWQFGGTVLDDGVMVIRRDVYRATGDAVEYGDRTISSPVACHAFIYKAMLSAKRCALSGEPFTSDTGRTIVHDSATGVDARPVADWVMCRGDVVVDERCYYAEEIAELQDYRCPVAVDEPWSPRFQQTSHASSPRFRKTVIQATTTDAVEDVKNDYNTADDQTVSTVIV
ncbi:uncharacterized protein LOC100571398 [Acyrthosiphon pisum]|uniref:Uncharacterized protein n=1 Tax=Acyrthosiphon pisum TaxID=7029 RepID=A0A8R2D6D8_ACYPI|nr:uncharacterized protein LOC100571398 [Acyrthosiphon pisum]XP_016663648.1 uncharacterized protein LOC100571398 [Acyrthosiphon pisum]XP_016663649.1 uncharacterized protein LOC100571398 [Acyrthosiphon pisum]XP_016663651.1 uncharacterized protein LOC100571398 [Acyrthosiphon pisum]|eukprot:XP_003247673.1 PREDICTED: uncharacterized protein LOC100571398 [Acyrthosiphon pisum]